MSSVIAFEPYVVRVGRGDPFVQSAIYALAKTRGISFGPAFVIFGDRGSGSVSFTQ
jgi:hypothetical protein